MVVAGVVGVCIHQVEGSKAAVAALGTEELGAAMPVLHLAGGSAGHLLVAGAGHAADAAVAAAAAAVAGYLHVAVVWASWSSVYEADLADLLRSIAGCV